MTSAKTTARTWVGDNIGRLSEWCATIWDFGETAWREYRSAAFYVDLLRREGFTVESGSGGMPTAFCATWENGNGPTIGGYAEYDAVPGNCQAADVVKRPRAGLSPHAGGHTDPHSALGISCARRFSRRQGRHGAARHQGHASKFFGEPAEKTRGLEADSRRAWLLRRPRRRDLLSSILGAAVLQHRATGTRTAAPVTGADLHLHLRRAGNVAGHRQCVRGRPATTPARARRAPTTR